MQVKEVNYFDKNLIEQIYAIHNSVFLTYDKMNYNAFENEFKQDNRVYFVMHNKEKVIGYIGAINCIDCFEIIGIGVDKKYQNSGVGTMLLKHLFNKAKEGNITKIFLEVDERNITAQNFYKKNGFVITNIRKKYYKDNDALIMMCSNF